MNVKEDRMKKVVAFLEAIAKTDLKIGREMEFNIQFRDGVTPTLRMIPPKHNLIPHADFKQLMDVTEEYGMKFTFREGAFYLSF